MAHALEQNYAITATGEQVEITSFAFVGQRSDIWHRLGQQYGGVGNLTADEAMRLANMDREVRTVRAEAPEGMTWAKDDKGEDIAPHYVVLDGKMYVTEDGDLVDIPTKIVGLTGGQGAAGHDDLSVVDRFLLAEEAIHASHGAAVWTTAGYLRDGAVGFACMEAPPIIIDPNGVADIIRQYLTIKWSYNATIPGGGVLGASNIRVVCANTLQAHDANARTLIRVKATAGAKHRYELAAQHWAMAQNEAKALALQGERMLAVANGYKVLDGLCEKVLGLKVEPGASKRETSLRDRKLGEVKALYRASTNAGAVGDNGYAAYQTVVEYLDWFSDVKGEKEVAYLSNQFDGTHDKIKQAAASYVLAQV